MKFIITEQQSERLQKSIVDYFDNSLTPYDGWLSPEEYKKDLKRDGELFLFTVDTESLGEHDHIWYTTHNNSHATIPKEKSPIVVIPDATYDALDGFFGNIWKPMFKEWFEFHTKLPVTFVDKFDWKKMG